MKIFDVHGGCVEGDIFVFTVTVERVVVDCKYFWVQVVLGGREDARDWLFVSDFLNVVVRPGA